MGCDICSCDTAGAIQGGKVKGRLLVVADGATSRLATKLGYCTEAPKGVCSRAFVEGGTHNTNFDGKQPWQVLGAVHIYLTKPDIPS